jgi:hypothetical protein
MILKGQNFRILTFDSTASKFKCVGMATNCTVTLTNNTEDASTKDDVGMAAKPTMTSQGWSVSVESLDVSDAAAMLTAINSLTPFTLMWDETSTIDNQTSEQATFARKGLAYCNDLTLSFNDRENSTKQLQFAGTSALETISSTPSYEAVSASAYTKGQFVRLFLSSDNTMTPAKVIAAAKSLSLHVSMTLEDATTKDTTGNWQIQEPTGLSYDISTSALVRGNDTITSAVAAQDLASIESIYEAGTPVKWKIANVSGANNRTASNTICSGSCLLTSLQISAQNRSNATYQATLTGYGAYTVVA